MNMSQIVEHHFYLREFKYVYDFDTTILRFLDDSAYMAVFWLLIIR